MTPALVALGAVGTLGGASALVMAFRRGQGGDRAAEQRLFRAAVLGLAVGSLAFLGAMVTAG
jgi:hypothetical protein